MIQRLQRADENYVLKFASLIKSWLLSVYTIKNTSKINVNASDKEQKT